MPLKRIALLLSIVLIACSAFQEISDEFDYGKVVDNVYSNDFFKCEIKLPKDWVVQSKEQTDRLAELGKEIAAGEDENFKSVLKASEVNSANLLSVFQYELGSPVEYNPSLAIVAENVSMAPGIKNGGDYLYQTRRLMKQSQFKYDYLSEEFESEKINGTVFHKMHTQLSYMDLEIKQIYYSTIIKGFSLGLIVSYVDDEQKKLLEESIHTFSFEE